MLDKSIFGAIVTLTVVSVLRINIQIQNVSTDVGTWVEVILNGTISQFFICELISLVEYISGWQVSEQYFPLGGVPAD